MKNYLKKLLLGIFISFSLSIFSQNISNDFGVNTGKVVVSINGDNVSVASLPQNGTVEVFNILGSKMMSFQLSNGKSTAKLNLPKGYYILKSDDLTRKIVVK